MNQQVLLQISIGINIVGLVQSVSLAISLFTRKSKLRVNYLLGVLLLILGTVIANTILILYDGQSGDGLIQDFVNAITLLLGPILWLITLYSLGNKQPIQSHWKHGLILVAYMLFLLLRRILYPTEAPPVWVNQVDRFAILWIWNIQFVTYLLWSFRKLKTVKLKSGSDGSWLRSLIKYLLIISLINFVLSFIDSRFVDLPEALTLNITVLLSFVVAAIVYRSQRSPMTTVIQSGQAGEEQQLSRLLQLMDAEKMYRNEDLTLSLLAGRMEINPKNVSSLINRQFGKNFNEFINEYRVKEVIEQIEMMGHEQKTIMGLAKEAGFKSNTAFYRAFKKQTDKTPKEYIRNKQ